MVPNYNAYQQPVQIQQQPPMQPAPNATQNSNIFWVQGESGAKAYPVAAGKTWALWDSESNSIYIKSVDASGIPQPLRILDFTERVPVQAESPNYITEEKLNAMLDEKFAAFAKSLQPQRNNYHKKGGKQDG